MSERVPLYDSFSEEYDVMVNWPERLARETPFLQRVLGDAGRRVLDVGSATGKHALHLAALGYDVFGADPSGQMVERARALAEGRPSVSFVQAGFGGLRGATQGEFDAAICLGNTLPHVRSQTDLAQTLADFAAVLRPGGVLVLQLLNYDRILARRQRFLGQTQAKGSRGEYLFFRFYDYGVEGLTFNMLIQHRAADGQWQWRVESTLLQPVLSSQLLAALEGAGFESIATFGNYGGDPFDPLESNDLIVVAHRTRT